MDQIASQSKGNLAVYVYCFSVAGILPLLSSNTVALAPSPHEGGLPIGGEEGAGSKPAPPDLDRPQHNTPPIREGTIEPNSTLLALGPGVDESRPILVHIVGRLSAVVSWVALEDFTGEVGEANLQDIAWLGPRACRHAIVVEQVMAVAPVFPLPFGALFSSLAVLEQEINHRSVEIASVLEKVSGCQEWAVEGSLDRNAAIEYRLVEGLQSGRLKLPDAIGRRHLEEQKIRRQLAADLGDWLSERLESLQQELARFACDFRQRRLTENKVSHWAFLVPEGQVEAFKNTLGQLVRQQEAFGLALRLTGPWPPYTFSQSAQ